ncbi:MAG TPA: DEAD/DEAH box helicase, partial [Rhizomicrobium sp.]|nr:DEAD/DEAH box helicase [Rhizomicrobium sp.]
MNLPLRNSDAKHDVLKDVFGFDSFRPGQEQVIDGVLSGSNVLAVMPTGSGKSLCYQVPALMLGGLTVVVSPLVALMQDQVAALRLAGVAADAINSSRSRDDNVAAWRRAAAGETRLLYMAPERLMTERMLDALARLEVRLIAVDEAHCISQWGPAFRPEYRALAVVQGFDRPNITLAVEAKSNTSRQLLDFLARHKGESGIVYCLSRKKTEKTAELLTGQGITALPYHAGMEKDLREANQN